MLSQKPVLARTPLFFQNGKDWPAKRIRPPGNKMQILRIQTWMQHEKILAIIVSGWRWLVVNLFRMRLRLAGFARLNGYIGAGLMCCVLQA